MTDMIALTAEVDPRLLEILVCPVTHACNSTTCWGKRSEA